MKIKLLIVLSFSFLQASFDDIVFTIKITNNTNNKIALKDEKKAVKFNFYGWLIESYSHINIALTHFAYNFNLLIDDKYTLITNKRDRLEPFLFTIPNSTREIILSYFNTNKNMITVDFFDSQDNQLLSHTIQIDDIIPKLILSETDDKYTFYQRSKL